MTDDAELLAWLALERQAVWLYPLIGARVPELADRARRAVAAHQQTRDRLVTEVAEDTTRAGAAYDVGPLTSPAQARAAAQDLERRIQAACAAAVRTIDPTRRALPLRGLRTAALAELTWGGSPTAFPGLT